MDTTIRDDFAEFIISNELFNSSVSLYNSQGGSLVFEGKGIYDKKPLVVPDEEGRLVYQGHRSILTLSMLGLTFMSSYFSLKGYFVEIVDNVEVKSYEIVNSHYSSNSNAIYCELKEAKSLTTWTIDNDRIHIDSDSITIDGGYK